MVLHPNESNRKWYLFDRFEYLYKQVCWEGIDIYLQYIISKRITTNERKILIFDTRSIFDSLVKYFEKFEKYFRSHVIRSNNK